MTARRRTTWVITGLVGLAALAGAFVMSRRSPVPAPAVEAKAEAVAAPGAEMSLKAMAEGLKRSDSSALAALVRKLEAKPEGGAKGLTDDEGAAWIEVIVGLRAGYPKFAAPAGRATCVAAVAAVLTKFAPEPAPAVWLGGLIPSFDLLSTGMNDPAPEVRAAALGALGRLWSWAPGRPMTPVEEGQLNEWKDRFHEPSRLRLADRDPRVRVAAVACLGLIPIDALAAPAVKYLDDPQSGDVRQQVLSSFAARPGLLTEDMILRRLHDHEPGLPQLAELVLQTRGLTKDQIALGRLITSPRPEMRASVIPLVKDRDDLDPVIWLLRLSHDGDETVRAKAVEALDGKDSPDVRARLREMADSDASPTIRTAAGKLVARLGGAESTASLPPLPGSSSLMPKAN